MMKILFYIGLFLTIIILLVILDIIITVLTDHDMSLTSKILRWLTSKIDEL